VRREMSRSTPHVSHRRVGQLGPRLESLCRTTAAHPMAPAVRSGRVGRHDPGKARVVVLKAPAGEAGAQGGRRVRRCVERVHGRKPPTDRVETTARVTGHAAMAQRRIARAEMVHDQADRRPTSLARHARTALRAKREQATVAVAGSAPPAPDETVAQPPAAGQSRVVTGTTDVAAVRRNVTPGGVIRGRLPSLTVTVLAGTTLIVRDATGTVPVDTRVIVHDRTDHHVHDPGGATAYLRDRLRRRALLRRFVRSRSRPLAAFVSLDSRPRLRRGSARSGSMKGRCAPQRARQLNGLNAPSLPRTQRLSRPGVANHRTWPRKWRKFCRRVRRGLSPRSTGSV
jgi:hypothetical protein